MCQALAEIESSQHLFCWKNRETKWFHVEFISLELEEVVWKLQWRALVNFWYLDLISNDFLNTSTEFIIIVYWLNRTAIVLDNSHNIFASSACVNVMSNISHFFLSYLDITIAKLWNVIKQFSNQYTDN